MEIKVKALLALAFITLFLFSGSTASAGEEARGIWVIRDQLTSPENIKTIVETAAENNFNLLLVQVVGRGDAYYQSEILPRAKTLKDQPLSFDPLALVLELAHEKGIKVHAWINAMYVAPLQAENELPNHVINTHPEWITYNYKGISATQLTSDDVGMEVPGMFLEPGLEEVREYLASIYQEVVTKYPVDGVHFDFIRYPNPNFGYHPEVRKDFKELYGVDPLDLRLKKDELRAELGRKKWKELSEKWDDYRREQVSKTVQIVYREVKKINPDVEVSAAVIGYYQAAYDEKMQDWKQWLAGGYLDIAVPMIYEADTVTVNWMVDEALKIEAETGGRVIPGLGAFTQINNVDALIEKVEHLRSRGARGVVFFAYRVMKDEAGYFEALKERLFPVPAEYPELNK